VVPRPWERAALAGPVEDDVMVIRRDRLGGLTHEYVQAA
jgi:hypothetical protein